MKTEEPTYKSKDLIISKEKFFDTVDTSFIGDDFEAQLEWAMLMIQSNFNQISVGRHLKEISRMQFDKAYLLSASLKERQSFFKPLGSLQATPEMFPLLNIRTMTIGDTVTLQRYKELTHEQKRHLDIKRKYAYERTLAFYKTDTEAFYGKSEGYELNPSFFNNLIINGSSIKDFPNPISLQPNYHYPENAIKYCEPQSIAEASIGIATAYQVAFSMHYEWSIYIKEYDNIGIIIPIEPQMLSEIYKTSLMRFENKKSMIHFVKEHYRRKSTIDNNQDFSVYVNKYLRGEYKFDYKGFKAEIIPPKYELIRAKTKKKFIDPNT
jgi:hypothetical protein